MPAAAASRETRSPAGAPPTAGPRRRRPRGARPGASGRRSAVSCRDRSASEPDLSRRPGSPMAGIGCLGGGTCPAAAPARQAEQLEGENGRRIRRSPTSSPSTSSSERWFRRRPKVASAVRPWQLPSSAMLAQAVASGGRCRDQIRRRLQHRHGQARVLRRRSDTWPDTRMPDSSGVYRMRPVSAIRRRSNRHRSSRPTRCRPERRSRRGSGHPTRHALV